MSNKLYFAQGQPSETRIFVLDASESKTPLQRADFYCGIYNSPDRVGFSIPNLPPGRYAVSIAKVTGETPDHVDHDPAGVRERIRGSWPATTRG